MKALWMVGVCLLLAVGAVHAQEAPANGELIDLEFIATHEISELNELITNFYEPDQARAAQYAVDEYRIRLASTYREDEPIVIVSQFFVPKVDEPTAFPVYVNGAGSTGIADQCAPSREQAGVENWGSYRLYMLTMAAQGFLAAQPDYAGFNDPDRVQPYYVSEMAGRVVLDTARAVLNWSAETDGPATAEPAVIIAGYSQGGQTVFAAKDMVADYAPDVPLVGIIGFAPVTNMASHMLTLSPVAPYRIAAYAEYYGVEQADASRVFTDYWLPTMPEDVVSKCVFDAVGYWSRNPAELYRPEILDGLLNDTLDEVYPELDALLDLNSPGFVSNDLPALIVQGTEDATIPMPVHEAFVEDYCAAGNYLNELMYQGANHFHLREISYTDVLGWIDGALAGEVPENACAS